MPHASSTSKPIKTLSRNLRGSGIKTQSVFPFPTRPIRRAGSQATFLYARLVSLHDIFSGSTSVNTSLSLSLPLLVSLRRLPVWRLLQLKMAQKINHKQYLRDTRFREGLLKKFRKFKFDWRHYRSSSPLCRVMKQQSFAQRLLFWFTKSFCFYTLQISEN